MLAAYDENWTEALAAFKTAVGKNELPEIEYLIGCCYFQLQMPEKAQPFLLSAVGKDADFADAWFIPAW